MLNNTIAFLAGKGGVGKTALASATAGLAALSGWRVLAVDCDPQGNLAREFGYMEQSDGGEALLQAVVNQGQLRVLREVRPNLDVVPGGPRTQDLIHFLEAKSRNDDAATAAVGLALATVADNYDLVVIDTPPASNSIHDSINRCVRFVVAPTSGDAASNDGLAGTFEQIMKARTRYGSRIELLGVVVTFMPANAKAADREVRARLRKILGPDVRIFEPSIRLSKKAAIDLRNKEVQAYEYERLKALNEKATPWFEVRRTGTKVESFSTAAAGLASDYQQLTDQILELVVARIEADTK